MGKIIIDFFCQTQVKKSEKELKAKRRNFLRMNIKHPKNFN